MKSQNGPANTDARMPIFVGVLAIALLFAGLGFWGVNAQIAGAIIAKGTVALATDHHVVQHPDGGVVDQIFTRNGSAVRAGDVLLRFDDTYLQSELAITEQQLLEIYARKLRLAAERDQRKILEIPSPLLFANLDQSWVQSQIDGQNRLFIARLNSRTKEAQHVAQQQTQIEYQIQGFNAQSNALLKQLDLINMEMADQQTLRERGLVPVSVIRNLQRRGANLEGELGQLTSAKAQASEKIAGLSIQALKRQDQWREEAITRIRDLRYSEIGLVETRTSLLKRLDRLTVRAPITGIIHRSSISSAKTVVIAAEPMMLIIPSDQPLHISAHIDPINITQINAGQDAVLRFPTFNRQTAPEVAGHVIRLSPDTSFDEVTGFAFYEVILAPDMQDLDDQTIQSIRSGMPVEVFIKTSERTPLSYLLQPFENYFRRAFREE
ncbi:MAG: HlyD family type I secretion periplasmic adaptor subunit [Paracoccaceae bacterium]